MEFRSKQWSKPFGSLLHHLRINPSHQSGRSTRSREELIDKQTRKLVFFAQRHRFLEIVFSFGGKAANYVGGDGHSGHPKTTILAPQLNELTPNQPVLQKIDYVLEICPTIFTFHVGQHLITPALHRHVQKTVNPWMVHYLGHLVQMLEDIGWIGHSQSETTTFRDNLNQLP